MGLLDIFYSEINRVRDRLISDKEKKEIVKNALRKSLIKFKFLWDDQIMGNAYTHEAIKEIFTGISGDFLNLAVEVDTTLNDKEIVNNLREMSKQFIQMANSPRVSGFMQLITYEMTQFWERMEAINKKLEE